MSVSGAIGGRRRFGHDSPIRHWCYRRASPLDRTAWSLPVMQYGQPISLFGVARGSSCTVPVRPALLETWVPRYSLWQQLVTSRWPPSSVRSMVWGPPHAFVAVGGGGGPCRSPRPRPTPWPPGWAGRFRSQGVGRDGPRAPRVGRGRAFPWGSGAARPVSKGSGEAEPPLLVSVGTEFRTEGLPKFVITFLIYRKASS
jgi:hypothetical protein